ncbi:NfeD family protein [Vreelandella aquamarina]
MPNTNRDQRNAAWQAANEWRARAAQTRPTGLMSSVKLFFTWLAVGALMIVAVVLGLVFMLIGWAMMPFLRRKMNQRMDEMRAQQAQDIGTGSGHTHQANRPSPEALEGSYEVKDERTDR